MKNKKFLAVLLAGLMGLSMFAFAGCFGPEGDSTDDGLSSDRESWYDQNVDPEGWT